MIVSLSGMKTNPIAMEQHVASHPEVREVLMTGMHQPYTGLLIEPMTNNQLRSTAETAELKERLWLVVQEVNQLYPTDSRISKSRILFTDPQKPMHRAGKGTIQRKATMESYAEKIDALYAAAEESAAAIATHKSPTQEKA